MRRATKDGEVAYGRTSAVPQSVGVNMLVLTRKPNQAIVIGDDVRVVIVSVDRDQVLLGIEAPRQVTVHRAEVYEEIVRGRGKAAVS